MISTQNLGQELNDLGQAIGLVDGSGNLNTHWFENPLGELESVFKDQTQRDGLMNLLDALLPPATLDGLPQGEKWHPLLGNDPSLRGNVYLTVKDNGANVLFGIAGDFSTSSGTTPAASLRARLPLISANSGIHAIAGTSDDLWFANIVSARNRLTGGGDGLKQSETCQSFFCWSFDSSDCSSADIRPLPSRTQRYACK